MNPNDIIVRFRVIDRGQGVFSLVTFLRGGVLLHEIRQFNFKFHSWAHERLNHKDPYHG